MSTDANSMQLYTSALGVGAKAYGAGAQAGASRDYAGYNEGVARNNAELADWSARDAIARGNIAAQNQMKSTRLAVGSTRASMAARGLDITTGSAASVIGDVQAAGMTDAQTIRDNAEREAWAYRVRGTNFNAEAAAFKRTGDANDPTKAGLMTVLGGSGKVASSWYAYRNSRAQPDLSNDAFAQGNW